RNRWRVDPVDLETHAGEGVRVVDAQVDVAARVHRREDQLYVVARRDGGGVDGRRQRYLESNSLVEEREGEQVAVALVARRDALGGVVERDVVQVDRDPGRRLGDHLTGRRVLDLEGELGELRRRAERRRGDDDRVERTGAEGTREGREAGRVLGSLRAVRVEDDGHPVGQLHAALA